MYQQYYQANFLHAQIWALHNRSKSVDMLKHLVRLLLYSLRYRKIPVFS